MSFRVSSFERIEKSIKQDLSTRSLQSLGRDDKKNIYFVIYLIRSVLSHFGSANFSLQGKLKLASPEEVRKS